MIKLLNTEIYERNIKADKTQLKWELVKISRIKQGHTARWKIQKRRKET